MLFEDEHIANIRDGGVIADYTGKPYLPAVLINAEAKRVLDRTRHDFPVNALGPITIRQEIVNHVQAQAFAIRADQKLAPPALHHHVGIKRSASHHPHILPRYLRVAPPSRRLTCSTPNWLIESSPQERS